MRFVDVYHRHHKAPQGGMVAIGASNGESIIGVVIIGHPVARGNQDGWTAEVTRLCVIDGYKNAGSMLYGAAWRASQSLGYRRLITYTLVTEPGTSLIASGWRRVMTVRGRSWDSKTRPRVDKHPLIDKIAWEVCAKQYQSNLPRPKPLLLRKDWIQLSILSEDKVTQ